MPDFPDISPDPYYSPDGDRALNPVFAGGYWLRVGETVYVDPLFGADDILIADFAMSVGDCGHA